MEINYFSKQDKIIKKDFILEHIIKRHLLEFQKTKIEKEDIFYKAFQEVDTPENFHKKYLHLINTHTEIKKMTIESLLEQSEDFETLDCLLEFLKFTYLCKFRNINFFNVDICLPEFIILEFNQICFWILCAVINEPYNSLFILIKKFQLCSQEEDIKNILIEILNKIYQQYGKKS